MKKVYYETVLKKYLDLNKWIFGRGFDTLFLENSDKDVEVGDGEDDCVEGDEEEKGVDDDVDAFLSSMYKESLEEDRRRRSFHFQRL